MSAWGALVIFAFFWTIQYFFNDLTMKNHRDLEKKVEKLENEIAKLKERL